MIRHLSSPRLILALAPLLMLAGCGKSSAPQAASTASGEILPGSVSDAMLETDRSQAQAPLAPAAHSASVKADASVAADASGAADEGGADGAGIAPPEQGAERPKPAPSAKAGTP